jgi:DNA-binding GntR family transcriptional regulator
MPSRKHIAAKPVRKSTVATHAPTKGTISAAAKNGAQTQAAQTQPARTQPTQTQPTRERAYLHLQQSIASGKLPAGSDVSELALARELGISRTPIREAIGQLVAEGLLEQTHNRGAVVAQLSRQDIINLYQLRQALEVFATGQAAAASIRSFELERMRALVNDFLLLHDELVASGKTSLSPEQMHRFSASDLGFHTMLLRVAGNSRIMKTVNEARLLVRIFATHRRGHEAWLLKNLHNEHVRILDAVVKHDTELAMKLMTEHIETSQQERLDEFDHWEREASLRSTLPVYLEL